MTLVRASTRHARMRVEWLGVCGIWLSFQDAGGESGVRRRARRLAGRGALGWRGEILGAAPQPSSQATLEAVEVAEHNRDHEQAERGRCQKTADHGDRHRSAKA